MNTKARIKVLIAEDHDFTRQTLALALKKHLNHISITEAADGEQAVKLFQEINPDIILMDISMPRMDGISATKIIKQHASKTKIIILTSHTEKEAVFSAFSSGADAYCSKEIKNERLFQVMESVLEGAIWLDPEIAQYIISVIPTADPQNEENQDVQQNTSSNKLKKQLTLREKEILALIVEGMNNKEIAERCCISLFTVKHHVAHIIEKLAVDDRTQAAVKALKDKLV